MATICDTIVQIEEVYPPKLYITVDWEIFMLEIICIKNFCGVKFLWFHSIREIFLTIDSYNMNEHLESS